MATKKRRDVRSRRGDAPAAPMKNLSDCRLYTFVDSAYLHGKEPAEIARQLCDGGSDLIQLRAKDAPTAEVERMAKAILPVTRAANVGLVINDHWELATRLGADICHLGQEDFFDAGRTHKSELPHLNSQISDLKSPLLGLSTHAPVQAEQAVAADADYIAIGPIYATGTKPTARPVTLDYVRWAADNIRVPWFAIGGVNLSNLDDVLAAGARRICVVSAILNAPDIARACQEFKNRLPSAPL